MKPAPKLLLRRESLAQLGTDELSAIAGGPQVVGGPSTPTMCDELMCNVLRTTVAVTG